MDHLTSGVQDQPGKDGKTPSLLKIQKINWAWWHTPVTVATQEAEAENCLNLGRGGYSDLKLHHCTLARVIQRDSISKQKKKVNRARHGGSSL